jgi:hypothetical protein
MVREGLTPFPGIRILFFFLFLFLFLSFFLSSGEPDVNEPSASIRPVQNQGLTGEDLKVENFLQLIV